MPSVTQQRQALGVKTASGNSREHSVSLTLTVIPTFKRLETVVCPRYPGEP